MYDEFEQAAEDDAQDKFETWHKTIVSENSFHAVAERRFRVVG